MKRERAVHDAYGSKRLPRVIVVGLDGATDDILQLLMRRGCIPHMQRIYGQSSRGVLLSTMPPVTAPAWVAMATGLNPGRTGVIDHPVVPEWSADGKRRYIFVNATGENKIVHACYRVQLTACRYFLA